MTLGAWACILSKRKLLENFNVCAVGISVFGGGEFRATFLPHLEVGGDGKHNITGSASKTPPLDIGPMRLLSIQTPLREKADLTGSRQSVLLACSFYRAGSHIMDGFAS